MLNTSFFLESFLQKWRFRKARPYLNGRLLDFGGNNGELKQFVTGEYVLVNYDYSAIGEKPFDTIVALAVIEHMEQYQVVSVFKMFNGKLNKGGMIFLTTPHPMAKPVLEFLALIRLIDPKNLQEHTHYWTKNDFVSLARETGLLLKHYKRFQFGFNQSVVFEKL